MKKPVYLMGMLLWLSGCASKLPQSIVQAPVEPVAVTQVQKTPQPFLGRDVRWGGEILEVANAEDHTDVLILGRELGRKGEPVVDGQVDARFIARFEGFMEPAVFPRDKRLTVSGVITGVEQRKVGEFSYPYPVVTVRESHLWPDPRPRDDYRYYYGPYYGWGPYYRHPWWGYPYWW
jgi:outer membrane lipoprotein